MIYEIVVFTTVTSIFYPRCPWLERTCRGVQRTIGAIIVLPLERLHPLHGHDHLVGELLQSLHEIADNVRMVSGDVGRFRRVFPEVVQGGPRAGRIIGIGDRARLVRAVDPRNVEAPAQQLHVSHSDRRLGRRGLGPNSIENNFCHEFWLQKSLELWLEIHYAKKRNVKK